MTSVAKEIERYREGAEIYEGDSLCREKTKELLKELCLPLGLLPLGNVEMVEVGYNRAAGFVWQRRKSSCQHLNRKIGTRTKYSAETTAFVEKQKMKKVAGVKSKQLLLWVPLTDISIDDPHSQNITFRAIGGIKATYPASAFEEEEGVVEAGGGVEDQEKEEGRRIR